MKSYTFHVSIPGTGRTWRKIELLENYTLSHLHQAIQDEFEFDNDHMYSFFMSGKAWDRNSQYRLPPDTFPWEVGELLSPEEIALEAKQEAEEREAFKQAQAIELDELKREMKAALGNSDPTGQKLQVMFHLMDTLGVTYREPGNVLTTTLGSLGLKRKQTFMYLFDHGAEWRFKVRVHAINENADPDAEYPRIVEAVGTPPPQYRSWG